jgi:ankyrin repeat protein
LLIAAGASLDLQDHGQKTALIKATEKGHTVIAEALIAAGAKNIPSDE